MNEVKNELTVAPGIGDGGTARRLFWNYVVLFGGSLGGQIMFLLGLLYLARMLGPAGFGKWTFAQAVMLYALRGGELGLEVVGIRETSRSPDLIPRWITRVIVARLGLAIILTIVLVIASLLNVFPNDSGRLVVTFSLLILPSAFILEWVFESRQRLGLVSVARLMKGALFVLLVVAFINPSSSIFVSAVAYVASVTIPIVFVGSQAIRRYGIDRTFPTIRETIAMVRESLPIGAATLLSQYSLFACTIAVAYFCLPEQLGFFNAAHRIIIFAWAYGIVTSVRVVLPTLSRYAALSRSKFDLFVSRFLRLALIAATAVGLGGVTVAPDLVRMLFSSSYDESIRVFQVLVWALALGMVCTILEVALVAADRQKVYLRGMALLACLQTVFAPLLTLRWGIVGAAYSMLVSQIGYSVYLIRKSSEGNVRTIFSGWWKPLLAGAGASILVVALHVPGRWIDTVVVLTLYIMLLILMKALQKSDLDLLRRIFSGRREVAS
jgi:O-antigen/teichoic acid export membrane protein